MEGIDKISFEDIDVDSLFDDTEDKSTEEQTDNKSNSEDSNNEDTADVDVDSLFSQESVGSGDNNGEDNAPSESGGTSPDFFSSIANAFVEEGIFPDIDEETIKNTKTAKDFRKLIDEQIKAGLDEQQQRVIECLNAGMNPTLVQQLEGQKNWLDKITLDELKNEDNEDLRKRLIFQDFINKGYSQERAEKMTLKSVETGNDVDDAKDALENLKDINESRYKRAKEDADKLREEQDKKFADRKKAIEDSIMKDDFFKNVKLDNATRKQAYKSITEPVFKTKEGRYLTTLQKAEHDDPAGFSAKIAILFTITNGLKDLDGIGSKVAQKEIRKGFAELETKINSTQRDSSGRLKFTSGVDDKESYSGIRLAI